MTPRERREKSQSTQIITFFSPQALYDLQPTQGGSTGKERGGPFYPNSTQILPL
jgi:hypothetical protein